ncbi:MAG TPA: orotidine-5'-phosphate decarboxylase [Saprospirales bacterium]|nr:orotidine-5'-phosphate decarboxylase [Saprospirales bacterium]
MNRTELVAEIFRKKSFLCVGLDTEWSKIPAHLLKAEDPVFEFNRQIIDATRDYCVAYKPNLAFYEALGPSGWISFAKTIEYIGHQHFIIADAKRGDIGNTSRMYAEAFFQRMDCDAVTVAPYMGEDSVAPFLDFPGKWAIVLVHTSNKGSEDFQRDWLEDSRMPLWEKVLVKTQEWGTPENLMFVVGATHPESFIRVRELAPDHFLLVPGVGAQGGDLASICEHGMNHDCGLLINASRSIIYASNGTDFALKASDEAKRLQSEMEILLKNLPHAA